MASKNRVNLLGNLGRDPELRYTPQGAAVATISLATSEHWRDKAGERQERTEWHRVVFYGELAKVVCEYLVKGSSVDIEGSLRTERWTDKDDIERYSTQIVARQLLMLGGGKRKKQGEHADLPQHIPAGDATELEDAFSCTPF